MIRCLSPIVFLGSVLATLSVVPSFGQWSEESYEPEERAVASDDALALTVDWKPPEAAEDFGRTSLMEAVSAGDAQRVRELLAEGADPLERDDAGSTALFYLPPKGRTEVTELILEAGVPVDDTNEAGLTALTLAALLGRADLVELLLEWSGGGADPSHRPPDGEPPLARALRKGHLKTARLLLQAGAEVNPLLKRNTSLLYRQASAGDAEGIRLLLEHGAGPDPRVGKEGVFPGETPLLAAARLGHAEVARALIVQGASLEALDPEGKTPLILAAEGGHLEAARVLLEGGADLESTGGERSRTTPIGFAAMGENPDVVKLFLEHGAEVDARNRSDVTPLMLAAFGEEPASVRHLLEAGAAVDLENRDGNTALVFAVLLRRVETTRLLLEAGASTAIRTRILGFGHVTPLHLAAGRGHDEITRLLLEHGAETDVYGQIEEIGRMTPLLMAARAGAGESIRMLLEHGADPSMEDDEGKSALAHARERGHRGVVAMLETVVLVDRPSVGPSAPER